jgi:3-deoxy-D-manno-octulosonic-acid transferase
MNLKQYRIIQLFLSPVVFLYLLYRKLKGKEHPQRFPERLGKPSAARPDGSLVWVHAASIGEAVSTLPLLEAIEQKYPAINILMTTGTVTSAKLLEKKLSRKVIHQFVPVDMLPAVRKFLTHWQPNLAIWVESELWPNLVCETKASGCDLALINARMAAKTLEKWQKHKELADNIFSSFSICLAQNDVEAEKFSRAGVAITKNAGNLKYESPALLADPSETAEIISQIGNRTNWLAASTSDGEEAAVADAHTKLSQKFSDILTIIAPRHPNRASDIRKMLEAKGLKVSQRSRDEKITPQTDIYLADTIGELGIFYRIAGVVFMGGSLIPHGGQNPLEPARLNCAIITGTHTHNFKDIYADMQSNNAVLVVSDKDVLVRKVEELLSNNAAQDKLANNALEFINSKSGVVSRYMQELEPYFKKLG